jgi:hypothetical protein
MIDIGFRRKKYYNERMETVDRSAVLDEMLEPLSRSLGVETARALVSLHPTPRTEARVQELAEKCNEGQLTPEEREEYEAYVEASTLIGILQAKARRVLRELSCS